MINHQPATPVRGYEPNAVVGRARFAGAAAAATAMTLAEAFNIKTVIQASTGNFAVTLSDKILDFFPIVQVVSALGANIHECPVTAINLTAGTFTFSHYYTADRTAAYVAAALNDGVSPVSTFHIFVYGRTSL